MRKNFKKENKIIAGYTIIETMIAMAIFLIVIVVGVGALLNAHLVNKKSQDMRSIMDSLNFAMEDMSRNIRTGYNYHCLEKGVVISSITVPLDCKMNGGGIAFESSEGDPTDPDDQWVYYISEGKLFRSTMSLNNPVQMTPDEVILQSDDNTYNFSVIGAKSGDGQQPFVIIRLIGKIVSRGKESPFSLQTMVSQRLRDI